MICGSAAESVQPADADQRWARLVFVAWIIAFLFKHGGSAWDVAWHFRYPFGTFEPPHLVNIFGSGIAAALIVFHTMTGRFADRLGLPIIQGGFALFLIANLLDVLNHYLYGLDVTVWSPSHMLTFAATTVVLGGVIYSMRRLVAPGRWRLGLGVVLWAFLLDDALFMVSQQEYGVVAIAEYLRGRSSASPALLALAGRNPIAFVEGGIPHWVYPLWLVCSSALVLVSARRVLGWRWSASVVALLYLAYRVVGFVLLSEADFPRSFIPAMLLGAAAMIDLAEQRRWSPLGLSAALVALFYTSAALIDHYTLMPQFALSTAPVAFLLLWCGLLGARALAQRKVGVPAVSSQ